MKNRNPLRLRSAILNMLIYWIAIPGFTDINCWKQKGILYILDLHRSNFHKVVVEKQ